jgi:hypothetical protein
MMLSFLGGMAVQGGIEHLRLGMSNFGWIFQVFTGVIWLLVAIDNTMQRKDPASLEWLTFGKKKTTDTEISTKTHSTMKLGPYLTARIERDGVRP